MKLTNLGAIGLLLLAPAAAGAQNLNSDVQCLIVSNVFAKQGATEQERQVSQLTSSFFIGRIDGRATPATLRAAMLAQKKGMAAPDASKTMKACAAQAGAANGRIVGLARQLMSPPKK